MRLVHPTRDIYGDTHWRVSVGLFAVVMPLPRIMTAFGADVNSIPWVMTGYLIARAVPMPALGWMASLIGHRNLYL